MRCRLRVGRGNRSGVAEAGGSQHLAPAWSSRPPKTIYKYISYKRREEANQIPGCCQVLSSAVAQHPPAATAAPLHTPRLSSQRGGAGREVAGGGLTVRGLETGFLEQRRLQLPPPPQPPPCIQHPGRVDSSHPDPERHASGGLTQTPGRD